MLTAGLIRKRTKPTPQTVCPALDFKYVAFLQREENPEAHFLFLFISFVSLLSLVYLVSSYFPALKHSEPICSTPSLPMEGSPDL